LERLCEGDARLLRRVAPVAGRDEPRYEVFHDVLAAAILDWRARLLSRRAQRRLTTLLALIVSLAVALAATLAYAVDPPWTADAEGATVDARAAMGGSPVRSDDVTIVDFDQASVARLGGKVPLDRRVHARMIDALRRAGAKVIAYDIQFHVAAQRPRVDRALQEAVRRADGRIVLSSFRFGEDDRLLQFGDARPGRTDRLLASLRARLGYSGFPTSGDSEDPTYSAIEPSVRFAPKSPVVPALATAAGQAAGVDTSTGEDPVAIEFRGGARSFRTVSAVDVLSGSSPAGSLRDKVVLVGMSDPRGGDGSRLTPVGRMPGVEIHANAYAALVRGRHPARDILIIALIALIPALVAHRRAVVAAAVILGGSVAYAIVAQVLFASGWIMPVALPLAALAASSAGLVAIRVGLARAASSRRRTPRPPSAIASPPSPVAAGEPLIPAGA
jgi:adenylate cyclase